MCVGVRGEEKGSLSFKFVRQQVEFQGVRVPTVVSVVNNSVNRVPTLETRLGVECLVPSPSFFFYSRDPLRVEGPEYSRTERFERFSLSKISLPSLVLYDICILKSRRSQNLSLVVLDESGTISLKVSEITKFFFFSSFEGRVRGGFSFMSEPSSTEEGVCLFSKCGTFRQILLTFRLQSGDPGK